MPSTAAFTDRLDALETSLPTVPARILHFQRALAAANYDRTNAVFQAIFDSYRTFFETLMQSTRTVFGQARAAGEQVAATVGTGAKTVAGQASAQARKVSDTAQSEVTSLVDRATDAVEDTPGSGTPYEQWSKADLVDRAKELNITGPTRMSKDELIKALRAA
jgi:hypothetical protein